MNNSIQQAYHEGKGGFPPPPPSKLMKDLEVSKKKQL